jgi:hypothetical protein
VAPVVLTLPLPEITVPLVPAWPLLPTLPELSLPDCGAILLPVLVELLLLPVTPVPEEPSMAPLPAIVACGLVELEQAPTSAAVQIKPLRDLRKVMSPPCPLWPSARARTVSCAREY